MVRLVVLMVWCTACDYPPLSTLPDDAESAVPATITIMIEAEMLSSTTQAGGHSWTPMNNEPGYSGTSYMQCLPVTGATCLDTRLLDSCGPSLVYQLTITQPDTYFVHARMLGHTASDDSIWVAVDGTVDSKPLTVADDGLWHWTTTGRSYSLAFGLIV